MPNTHRRRVPARVLLREADYIRSEVAAGRLAISYTVRSSDPQTHLRATNFLGFLSRPAPSRRPGPAPRRAFVAIRRVHEKRVDLLAKIGTAFRSAEHTERLLAVRKAWRACDVEITPETLAIIRRLLRRRPVPRAVEVVNTVLAHFFRLSTNEVQQSASAVRALDAAGLDDFQCA